MNSPKMRIVGSSVPSSGEWIRKEFLDDSQALSFEREGYGVNKPLAWRRLYGHAWGYWRDFGWRACFIGGGCE